MVAPGLHEGLELVLDQNSHRVSAGTVFASETGFKLFLGQQDEFPVLQRRHLTLAPGRRHMMEVSASHVSTDMTPGLLDMAGLEPATRGCRFPGETDGLAFHSRYSFASCRQPSLSSLKCSGKVRVWPERGPG
jgi:hypothetical protein